MKRDEINKYMKTVRQIWLLARICNEIHGQQNIEMKYLA